MRAVYLERLGENLFEYRYLCLVICEEIFNTNAGGP